MHVAAQTIGISSERILSETILKSYSKCIQRSDTIQIYSTRNDLKNPSSPDVPPRKQNLDTATYNMGNKLVEFESDVDQPMISNHENSEDESHDHHGKQDWSKVQTHAWTLLFTIAIKSFIEGITFALTLQDSFSAGWAFLVAMIFKLFPLEPGYAIILSDAGLNHFYENLFSTLAVLPIYLGKFL